jgi:hypothetical protein
LTVIMNPISKPVPHRLRPLGMAISCPDRPIMRIVSGPGAGSRTELRAVASQQGGTCLANGQCMEIRQIDGTKTD